MRDGALVGHRSLQLGEGAPARGEQPDASRTSGARRGTGLHQQSAAGHLAHDSLVAAALDEEFARQSSPRALFRAALQVLDEASHNLLVSGGIPLEGDEIPQVEWVLTEFVDPGQGPAAGAGRDSCEANSRSGAELPIACLFVKCS